MIILGIDPGSRNCGYGILHIEQNKILAAGSGIIKLATRLNINDKLLLLGQEIQLLLHEYQPDFSAVEQIFYGKNIQTAFILGHVRGVIIYKLKEANVSVFSYSPREIKQSLTGKGSASKKQVEFMVQSILKLKKPALEDAADGLACALCLYNKERLLLGKK